ncbi:uncharacterized protein LOC115450501 isoform X2 [Manduca sexta]|uniref:uncharacterized protein LOC115450501 isoform X2 n=1 Tax=Manduca sexta TaxID=7130 RepID=UPI001183024F|nr:uncharacterized protein LOC115450501 isoform X2 [Manduca sexta]
MSSRWTSEEMVSSPPNGPNVLGGKCYRTEVFLHVSATRNLDSRKYIKCTARMQELQDEGVQGANDEHHCQDMEQKPVLEPLLNEEEITVDEDIPTGGIQDQDPNDPIFKSLAEVSMQKYLQSIGSIEAHKVVRVEKASTQVVAGLMTRIEFVISPSDGNSGDVISCYSEIWEQPWMNKKEITVHCKINNHKYRAKRDTPVGGIHDQDPNDPIVSQPQ